MVFYIYKMKDIKYIGSTNDIKLRTETHKTSCYNKNSKDYNYLIYQYIREKQMDIELKILGVYKRKCSFKIRRLVEQYYINEYNSVNNGLNTYNAFFNRKKYLKKYNKQYREENKDKLNEYNKKYNKEYNKQYYEKNKNKLIEKQKEYYEENKEYYKKRYEKNKEKELKRFKKYYEDNKKKINEKKKQKINCCKCNCLIRKDSLKRHQKSKKCLKYNL